MVILRHAVVVVVAAQSEPAAADVVAAAADVVAAAADVEAEIVLLAEEVLRRSRRPRFQADAELDRRRRSQRLGPSPEGRRNCVIM